MSEVRGSKDKNLRDMSFVTYEVTIGNYEFVKNEVIEEEIEVSNIY